MRRLDQLQLGNEETMVAHGIVQSGWQREGVGNPYEDVMDIIGLPERDLDPQGVAMRLHVADANRQSADVPAPVGGYGSIAEGNRVLGTQQQQQLWQGDADRWRAAKAANATGLDGVMRSLVGVNGMNTTALRHWAHENAANTEKRAVKSELPSGASRRDPYSARRKWSSVSFAVPENAIDAEAVTRAARARLELDYRVSHHEADRLRDAARVDAAGPREHDELRGPSQLPPGFSAPSYGFIEGRNVGTLDKTHSDARQMFPGELLT
jgi:hypothetical protein